jgi:hypothetical protein
MTTTNSLVEIVPSPSLSNNIKASLKSSFYSLVKVAECYYTGCLFYCFEFIIILLKLIIIDGCVHKCDQR